MTDLPQLPRGFVFGTSTAAYQIEGGVTDGGRGASIWDTFCAEEGRIVDGSSGATACDSYHLLDEPGNGDLALLRDLGAGGYRFSIAWSRVQPDGRGPVNPAGLDHYERLVDGLLEIGVAPMATLYHWDLPQALQSDLGGWRSPELPARFAEYAGLVAHRLGDRVADWVPVNEPNVAMTFGHGLGVHAPGEALLYDSLPVGHHLNLAHGAAVRALRETGVSGRIGTANNHGLAVPDADTDADRAAADEFDQLWNRMFAEPMLRGRYPERIAERLTAAGVDVAEAASVHEPLDFYGVNYYNPYQVAAAEPGAPLPFEYRDVTGDHARTDFGWPVAPDGLRDLLLHLRRSYPELPPVVVTESGCSYNTGPDEHGEVADDARIAYYDVHLRAVAEAIDAGVDVRGFYAWSLLDNFEWAEGYTQRFGLVHVDFDTLARTRKRSFGWYADVIAGQPRCR